MKNYDRIYEQHVSMSEGIKHKWTLTKRKIILLCIAIGTPVAYLLIRYVIPAIIAIGILLISVISEKPKVYEDVTQYSACIGDRADSGYGTTREEQFQVFPEKILDNSEVLDFKYVYYNPWDSQYVSYLTVRYTEEDYQNELERLEEIGIEDYKGIYSVTGEPVNYDLVAIDADSYQGFCYAMVPEKEKNTITYVGIIFCNYFLDLDIYEYVPSEYLLPGFDATLDNPYRAYYVKNRSVHFIGESYISPGTG